MREISRRTFLKASAATTVGVSTLTVPAAARGRPKAQSVLGDFDMDGQFTVENHRVADPATDDDLCDGDPRAETERENVLHVTSNGRSTRDYSAGLVNLEDRFDEPLTLNEVSADESVAFNYFQGPHNENAAPDEVFLIVRKRHASGGGDDDTGLFAAFKTINDGVDPDPRTVSCEDDNKRWRGVDVSAQITGRGRSWSDVQVSEDEIRSGQMAAETARTLGSQRDRFESLLDRYGEGAELVAVGYGRGSIRQEIALDVYYDNLVVRRNGDDPVELDFPATIPMDVEFRPPQINTAGRGTLNASLSLRQEEVGLDPNDVIADSVKLMPYTSVAPVAGRGATARSVNVTGGGLRAKFRADRAADVLGTGEQEVLIWGRFDNEPRDVFLAQGSLTVRDPSGFDRRSSRE